MSASLASAEAAALTTLASHAATAPKNTKLTSTTTPTSTTSYIPLTTLFTPPKWCSTVPMTFFGDNSGLTSTFWHDTNFPSNDSLRVSMRSCYPPSFSYQPDLFATDGYVYSPGVCPSGYYAAKSNGAHASGKGKTGGRAAQTSWCCPTSFTFSAFQGCVSLAHPKTVTTLYQFGVPVQMRNPYFVLEPYIPVAWASSDLPVFTPTSAPLSRRVQCRRTVATSSRVARLDGSDKHAMANGSRARADGGLSTGAKAGIGVGVAIAAVVAIVMAVLLLKYRRKAMVLAENMTKERELSGNDTVELKNGVLLSEVDPDSRAEADYENYRAEADPANALRNELDENAVRAEVAGEDLRHELDGGWRGHEVPTKNVNNEKR